MTIDFTTTMDYPSDTDASSFPKVRFTASSGLPLAGDIIRPQGSKEVFVVAEREWVVSADRTELIVRLSRKKAA